TVPSSASSCLICDDNGGWAICRRSAARPKCFSSATARKYRRWRNSTMVPPYALNTAMVDCECSNISVRWRPATSERHVLGVFISPAYQYRVFVYFFIYIKASTVNAVTSSGVCQHLFQYRACLRGVEVWLPPNSPR